jgi:hypothetical protein
MPSFTEWSSQVSHLGCEDVKCISSSNRDNSILKYGIEILVTADRIQSISLCLHFFLKEPNGTVVLFVKEHIMTICSPPQPH